MLDVLLIGDVSRPEFRAARAVMKNSARVVEVPDVEKAQVTLLSADPLPTLVVVAVAHPGQFRTADIEALYRIAPLIKIVALLGTWCEGETRTGRPWPADGRVWWYHWPSWWHRQMTARSEGRRLSWEMPRTTTEQDRRVAGSTDRREPRQCDGLIAVAAEDYATYSTLADVLTATGYTTAWFRAFHNPETLSNVAAGIWDGGQLEYHERPAVAAFCDRLRPAPVIVLLDFPRIETVNMAKSLGALSVLGKPYSLDDLTTELGKSAEKHAGMAAVGVSVRNLNSRDASQSETGAADCR